MYRPDDRYVWDFWLARDGDAWHMFHLQAPRSLQPDDRHWNASVGHAVSTDLTQWTDAGTALEPGARGEWDDLAIWTGSVIRHSSGSWLMAYTGISEESGCRIERIGLAWSDDLSRWTKDERNPVLCSDPHWYEPPGGSEWQHGWRDPWLMRTADGWAMLISARVRDAEPARAGAVALATSVDGCEWTARAPVEGTAGRFAEVEVPQLIDVAGRSHLVFSARRDGSHAHRERADLRTVGTFCLSGDGPQGPFSGEPYVLDGDCGGTRYAGRITEHDGGLTYLAFLDAGSAGFEGAISDPTEVRVDPATGRLALRDPARGSDSD